MNKDDMVIFENQLNDDVPQGMNYYEESQKINNPFEAKNITYDEFTDLVCNGDIPIEVLMVQHKEFENQNDSHINNPDYIQHHNKEMYYDSFLNEYVPINPSERFDSHLKEIEKAKEDDFKLTEALFGTNNTDNTDIISQLIDIYKENKNNTCEFTEMEFSYQKIPIKIVQLDSLTELIISKTNLDKIDFLPPNIEKLTVSKSQLLYVDCKEFPQSLNYINFTSNKLQILININENVKTLILEDNNLSDVVFPQSMDKLSLRDNKFESISCIKNMTYLRELDLANNNISDIDYLLDSIEILNISKNCMTEINKLPLSLKEIAAYNNKIYKITCEFPKNLEKIDFYNNNFQIFPDLIESIKWVDLSYNELKKFPKNFKHLEYFDITANENLDFNPDNEDWKVFLECSSKNKQFQMDQHDNYIIKSDSPDFNFSDSDNTDNQDDENDPEINYAKKISKFDLTKRIIKPPSYEQSQELNTNSVDKVDENIWSYDLKNDIKIVIKPKRYVKLKKTYTI
jgi:hypothetical protein